jgi:hypothetical protein
LVVRAYARANDSKYGKDASDQISWKVGMMLTAAVLVRVAPFRSMHESV